MKDLICGGKTDPKKAIVDSRFRPRCASHDEYTRWWVINYREQNLVLESRQLRSSCSVAG